MRITGAEGYRKTAGELTGTARPGKEEKSIIMDKDMEQVLKKAEVLIEALPYIQKFNRKIIVVKYGGHEQRGAAKECDQGRDPS